MYGGHVFPVLGQGQGGHLGPQHIPHRTPPGATPDLSSQGAFRAYQGLTGPVPSSVHHRAEAGREPGLLPSQPVLASFQVAVL